MDKRQFLKTAGGILISASAGGVSTSAYALICRPEDPYFDKVRNFDADYTEDVHLTPNQMVILKSVVARLRRVRGIVGHGNFALLGFDEMLRIGKNYSKVERFTKKEIDFLEDIFYRDAARYGFFGEKVLSGLTDRVPNRSSTKVRRTGQYLFKGTPLVTYKQIHNKLGKDVVLTSGVRGMAKQMYLFLAKAQRTKGNLSRASRSLAPPGYSFHAAGDFDVGKRGWGVRNFSSDFAKTDVFKKLVDLGYARLRYPKDNLLGVRYEPWHIKVL
jgi:hypothetical protein